MIFFIRQGKRCGLFCETCARNLVGNEPVDRAIRGRWLNPNCYVVNQPRDAANCTFHNERVAAAS